VGSSHVKNNDPQLAIDYNDIYSELKSAISQRGVKLFELDQKSSDQPFFDPVNLYCFKEWFVNYYFEKSKKGKK